MGMAYEFYERFFYNKYNGTHANTKLLDFYFLHNNLIYNYMKCTLYKKTERWKRMEKILINKNVNK